MISKESFAMFMLFSFFFGYTQENHSVKGRILNSEGEGIPYANALLLFPSDSSLVKGTLTNEEGMYSFGNIPSGAYILKATLIGYQPSTTPAFDLKGDYRPSDIVLNTGEELDEVVVVGTKPLYQQKIDRMVINVESSIVSAGGSALEILERSPGVLVNRQSNAISIVGKDGVVVMINGKTSYVPVSALIQMLEGMSADNIEVIELITTPPANFDAEGNAGFINIVLKQRSDLGLNGSYSLSVGYNDEIATTDNINFNYRKGKVNLFGNYSFSLDQTDQAMVLSREIISEGNVSSTRTATDREPIQRNHNARVGMDVQASHKTILGVLVNGYDNRWTMDSWNTSEVSENGAIDSYIDLFNEETNHWKHFGANFNVKHNYTEGKSLSFDMDYLYYTDDNPNSYVNTFFDGDRNQTDETLSRSGKKTPIRTWVGKLDYQAKIGKRIQVEAGLKGTTSNFENDVFVENFNGSSWVIDPTLTNKSNLDEKIGAVYTSFNYEINEKSSVKAGLRYEYTDSQLDTETQGKVVDRQYGIFFPSIYYNRKLNDTWSMNWSYSKRITRPTFNDLAPFVILFDPNTFISGNASLQPAISNAFKYDINYGSVLLSLQYTDQDFAISNFQERYDEVNDRLVFEADNLDNTKTYGVTLGFPLKITHWWQAQNNFNYVDQKVKTEYQGEYLELDLGNFSANTSHSFTFSESFSGEITAFYSSKSFFGVAVYDAFYSVNIGLQKKIAKNGGTLRISANDIFDSLEFNGGTDIAAQNLKTQNLWDFSVPTVTLTYSQSFGNSKLEASRNRRTGAEEERRRVN